MMDGINECYREQSQALERAARLDSLGTQLAAAGAKRVRMIYYTVRGEREAAERERKALDLLAIQGGTTWQVEWFAVPIEGLAGALIGDLLATRRALDKLDALLGHVPSLEPLRDAVRIGYHYRRGEHERVAELGEAFVAKHPPRTVIGWGPSYALVALSMAECGRAARALEISERGLSVLTEKDHAYFVMYAPLLASQASAYAMLGDLARADAILQACTARLASAGEHAALAILCDKRARDARQRGDHKRLRESVTDMRRAALAAGNGALIAMADQWAEILARTTSNSAPPSAYATTPGLKAAAVSSSARTLDREQVEERTAITTFLLSAQGPARGRHVLDMIAQASGSTHGLLYTCRGTAITRVASLDDEDAPEPLETRIADLLTRRSGPGQYVVELDDSEVQDGSEERTRYHVIVLADPQTREHIAVAALREGHEPLVRVRRALLDEVSAVLVAASPTG